MVHEEGAAPALAPQRLLALRVLIFGTAGSLKDLSSSHQYNDDVGETMSVVTTNMSYGPSSARAAFAEARNLVLQERKGTSIETWLQDTCTIEDVQDAIEAAKQQYEAKSNSKRREWLGQASRGILAYGKVMDMLAQHHPEYVSLAWGTTKFLFVVGDWKRLVSIAMKVLTRCIALS